MALTATTVQGQSLCSWISFGGLYLLAGAMSEPQCTSVTTLLPARELDTDTLRLRLTHQFYAAIYFKGQGLVFRKQGITEGSVGGSKKKCLS